MKRIAVLALIAMLVLAVGQSTRPAAAQSGGTSDLTWNTVDGGRATFSTSGTYSLGGTIGQFNADGSLH